jgi:hypothetical protein
MLYIFYGIILFLDVFNIFSKSPIETKVGIEKHIQEVAHIQQLEYVTCYFSSPLSFKYYFSPFFFYYIPTNTLILLYSFVSK